MATKGRPGRSSVKCPWSALQTHLQGVDWATLAIMPEECRHRAALLSRLSQVKIARPATESKPKPRVRPERKPRSLLRACQRLLPATGNIGREFGGDDGRDGRQRRD